MKVKVAPQRLTLLSHGLYSPWTSPGQNTGVGSLSLLHRIFPTQGSNLGLPHCRQIPYHLSHQGSYCALSHSVVSDSLPPHGLYSLPGSSVYGDSPGKNTGGGCHSLFQGIFPTQGSNLGLLHCRQILYHLSHQGSL